MKKVLLFFIVLYIVYTRMVGIDWGLPYPMHPDERNMVNAIQQLRCDRENQKTNDSKPECMNPHFYAYGQLPLYVGYGMIKGYHIAYLHDASKPISYDEGAIALRIISVVSSLLTILIVYKITHIFLWAKRNPSLFEKAIALTLLSIIPYAIQFAHFGTTESLLMFLYSYIFLKSLEMLEKNIHKRLCVEIALLCGVAIGVKVSSLVFLLLPFLVALYVIISNKKNKKFQKTLQFFNIMSIMAIFVTIGVFISSPYNFISYNEFMGSMQYESAVALGKIEVFYTRPFYASLPYYFQLTKVFPYTLGLLSFTIFILSFFLLPAKSMKWWLLRVAFIIPFLTSGLMFAKWTRFMAGSYPIMTLIVTLGVLLLYRKVYDYFSIKNHLLYKIFFSFFILCLVLPGIAYVSVYSNEDVRFTASKWIQKTIPDNSTILSETANVVDIPLDVPHKELVPQSLGDVGYRVPRKNISVISFNFYDLDTDTSLQSQLNTHIAKSNYIFVPSRRLFANHTCLLPNGETTNDSVTALFSYKATRCFDLNKRYKALHTYYSDLFDDTKFQKVAEIVSYPKISLFGKTIIEFPDEGAEETWTVFDHPVIRIFKKNSNTL